MIRLFIPQIGNELKLISNWDCKVFGDSLNYSVFKALNIESSVYQNKNIDITFPKGTILKVDRLYVRAPASSYDSITFRITACPMKALIKARFFVKLLDANKIEFEEIIQSIEGFKKLKDSYRFVALTNEYKNSEHLSEEDSTVVGKILYSHFQKDKEITVKFNMPIKDVFNSIKFEDSYKISWPSKDYFQEQQQKMKQALDFRQEDIPMIFRTVPALDGFVSHFEISKEAGEIAEIFNINNKVVKDHWRTNIFGTPFAREVYTTEFATKIPSQLERLSDKLEQTEINYQGSGVPIKNLKELQKFLKIMRNN